MSSSSSSHEKQRGCRSSSRCCCCCCCCCCSRCSFQRHMSCCCCHCLLLCCVVFIAPVGLMSPTPGVGAPTRAHQASRHGVAGRRRRGERVGGRGEGDDVQAGQKTGSTCCTETREGENPRTPHWTRATRHQRGDPLGFRRQAIISFLF